VLSAIILCGVVLSVMSICVVYTEFNSLFVLIEHTYQVLPTIKLFPKSCSDEHMRSIYRIELTIRTNRA
jgi:hypothetical protein